jgi:hypothetical protein
MEIIWSSKARISFFQVLEYLDQNWTKKEIIQFFSRVELVIHTLQKNPLIFPVSIKNKEIRKAFVDKNNSLFYQVDHHKKQIYLLTFFDNRQNPERLLL